MEYKRGTYPMFPFAKEEREQIISDVGLNEKDLKEDIDAIKDWLQKQPHLATVSKSIEREAIEQFMINCKGSRLRAKQKIDGYYQQRALNQDMLQTRIKYFSDENVRIHNNYYHVFLPRLYKGKRIVCFKFLSTDPKDFNLEILYANFLMVADLRLKYECMLGDIWILDLQHCNIGHLMRINPITVLKGAQILKEGLGIRIFNVHVVNSPSPSLVATLLRIFKHFGQKIVSRVCLHHDVEELQIHIPKEYLPKDYGGELISLAEQTDFVETIMKQEASKKFLLEKINDISDESKRLRSIEEMAGTFKKLELD